jgi:hypothetical protein
MEKIFYVFSIPLNKEANSLIYTSKIASIILNLNTHQHLNADCYFLSP